MNFLFHLMTPPYSFILPSAVLKNPAAVETSFSSASPGFAFDHDLKEPRPRWDLPRR